MSTRVPRLSVTEIDELLEVQDQKGKGGMFYCGFCKTKEHTEFVTKQDRSGDEGMSAYVTCRKCKRQWRVRV